MLPKSLKWTKLNLNTPDVSGVVVLVGATYANNDVNNDNNVKMIQLFVTLDIYGVGS